MAHVLKGSHRFTCTVHTPHSSANGMNHSCLCTLLMLVAYQAWIHICVVNPTQGQEFSTVRCLVFRIISMMDPVLRHLYNLRITPQYWTDQLTTLLCTLRG